MCLSKALLLFWIPVSVFALLPPTEEITPGELLEFRQRKKLDYEQERREHEQRMVQSQERVKHEMSRLPWKSAAVQAIPADFSRPDSTGIEFVKNKNKTGWFLMGLLPFVLISLFLFGKFISSSRSISRK